MAGLQYTGSSFDPTRSVKLIGTYSKKRSIESKSFKQYSIYKIASSLLNPIGVEMAVG